MRDGYEIRQLMVPLLELASVDLRHFEPTKIDVETPKKYLADRRRSQESIAVALAEISLSNPWWPGAMAETLAAPDVRDEIVGALGGDELIAGDGDAQALLSLFEDLGRAHPILPLHFFRWITDQEIAATSLRAAKLLHDAIYVTGERRALATTSLAQCGLFEPLYDAYCRGLLACVLLRAGQKPNIPDKFGSVVNRLAEFPLPPSLFDKDAAFIRNALAHGGAVHDARGLFIELRNEGKQTRTEKVRTTVLLARLGQMYKVAAHSAVSAIAVYHARLVARSGVVEWALEEAKALLLAEAPERDERIAPFLTEFGARYYSLLGLAEVARALREGRDPLTTTTAAEAPAP